MKDNLIEKKTVLRNEKIISPRSGTKIIKGCSCKGNCSHKICGCVKKNTLCGEFCRCNDALCKNQVRFNSFFVGIIKLNIDFQITFFFLGIR